MKTRNYVTLALAALVVVALGAVVLAADTNIGTWKLNVAKSTFSPGPAPKSQTIKIEAWGEDGVKFTSDGVDAEGKPTHTEFQAKYDGKFNAYTGTADADMLAYKRIDANTIQATTQLKGKETAVSTAVVSKDGKTRTLTQTGTNAKGQAVKNHLVYEKQ